MKTVKIYRRTITQTINMADTGEHFSLDPWGKDDPTGHITGHDDDGKLYVLPDGFEVGHDRDGMTHVYRQGEPFPADLIKHPSGHPQLVTQKHGMPVLEPYKRYYVYNSFETFGNIAKEEHATQAEADDAARKFAEALVEMCGTVKDGRVYIDAADPDNRGGGMCHEIDWWKTLREKAGAAWDYDTMTGTTGSLPVEDVIQMLLAGPVKIEEVEEEQ